MRCFIEIDIPQSIKEYLSGKAERIKSMERPDNAYSFSITKKENLHITIAFLGEISENRVDAVIKKVSEIAGNYRPFECTLSKIEVIPKKRPRVIWVSLDESNTLSKLSEEIKEALMVKGENKEFAPHRRSIASPELPYFRSSSSSIAGLSFSRAFAPHRHSISVASNSSRSHANSKLSSPSQLVNCWKCRAVVPHITLARIKIKKFSKSIRNLPIRMDLFDNTKIEPLKFEVRELKIMQSILKKEGPEYTLIKSIPIKNNK
ncbi:RNA 2',3'-cyclic phosphodiesterase [uncultured archaeon]|nr:RNA 2',3'-cyclic phosphodiesterase [uncultured archaeon]